jgi:hypothetical protein
MEFRLSGRSARQIEYTAGRQNILADEYEALYKKKLDMPLNFRPFQIKQLGTGSEG